MMTGAVKRNVIVPSGARALFASRILIPILAFMLAPAFAAAPPAVATGNPRLAALEIEVWPEFDRPAALVILKGEIAANVPLPASVSLRIPAATGGPAAVAHSSASGGNLLNLKYDRKDAGNFITLKFDTPERFFHVEFYDPLVTKAPSRSYTYVWNGDFAADRLSVIVQEPAGVSDFSVTPPLISTATGRDGMRYKSADLGPIQAGKRLDVKILYTKTDPRTSTEIVKPKAPEATPSPLPNAAPNSMPLPGAAPSKTELALWLLGIVAALGLVIWRALAWWYGREERLSAPPAAAGFCSKCGAPSKSGDRFCSKCGAPLA